MYEAFLEVFPLCHLDWKKHAEHEEVLVILIVSTLCMSWHFMALCILLLIPGLIIARIRLKYRTMPLSEGK